MGNTQIELIQLIEGDCLYKEFLEQGKEGFQHIGTYVDNVQQAVEEFQNIGIEVIQIGRVARHLLAYMDTKKYFGIYLELLELMKRKKDNKESEKIVY
ncbi:MAG: VOC family protein [Candidatus Hodarchaeota archaeon]